MSESVWVLLGTSGVALASLGMWVRGYAHSRSLKGLLRSEQAQQELLLAQNSELQEKHTRILAALETAEKEARALGDRAESVTRRLRTTEASRDALEKELTEVRQAKEKLELESRTLLRRAETRNSELSDARGEALRVAQLLSSLGIVMPTEHHHPFDVARRPFTRAAIQELLVECAAHAVALVDDEGLVGMAAGHDAAVARLGSVASWASIAEAELSEVLCAPVTSWSVMDGRFRDHFVRIDGTSWWVGVENDGVAPLASMRRTHLRIVELPAPASPVPVSTDTVLELDDAPDALLSRKLTDWAARWGADAVTALDVEGRPLGATENAQPSSVMAVRRALTPVFRRLLRDGRYLDDTTLVARATGQSVLTLRMAGVDLEAPMLAIVGPTEVPERAIDELAGVLRWHISARHPESREAS